MILIPTIHRTAATLLLLTPVGAQASSSWEPEKRHRELPPGVKFGAHYFADWSGNWKGGRRNRDTYRSLTDAHLRLESEPLFGWEGTVVFLDAYKQVGRDGSLDTGDVQVYSNLDAPNRAQVASLWIEQTLADGRARLKFGKVDANTDFAALPSGGEFMHSSAGFSPTILGFPSYPDPAMSVNALLSSGPDGSGVNLRLGAYDGATAEGTPTGARGPRTFFDNARSDAYFLVAEAGATWDNGTAAAGIWHHTADLPRFTGGLDSGSTGFYAILDQKICSAQPGAEDERGWFLLSSYGWADEEVSPVTQHASIGLYGVGPIPRRDRDTAGLYVSHVEVSKRPGSGVSQDETAFELFYRVRVNKHIFLQPVIQFIRHPAAAPGVAKALVATLRVELRW